jgi:hypothetical protein
MKGDLLMLYLFDQIFRQDRILEKTAKPGAHISLAGVMPALWPLVGKMLPEGMMFAEWLEYGTHGTADHINEIVPVLKARIPTTLEIGLQDDNTMWFPQINVESQQKIMQTTAPLDMAGYVTAIWQVRPADINAAYQSRSSWQPQTSAAEFYADYLPKLVGEAAAADFERALRAIEKSDRDVKEHLYGFAFPWITAIADKFKGVDREAVAKLRGQYESIGSDLRKARENASPQGRERVDFWQKRTDFAIRWLDVGVQAADIGKLLGPGLKTGAPLPAAKKQEALAATDRLLVAAKAMIEVIVSDAKSPGDCGQVASLNRFVYDHLIEFRQDLASRPLPA